MTSRIAINFQRPDFVNKKTQGHRGPFAPILMGLETLVAINKWQLRQKDYPLLYESGIYYYTNPETFVIQDGTEYSPASEWHDIPTLLSIGKGDCKDLVAYRIAELSKVYNIETKPIIKWKWIARDIHGNYNDWKERMIAHPYYFKKILLVHVLLRWPDGHIEDPSKILGMGGEYL